jgi:hypothetical protein
MTTLVIPTDLAQTVHAAVLVETADMVRARR